MVDDKQDDPRKPYRKPELEVHGSLRELTGMPTGGGGAMKGGTLADGGTKPPTKL